MRKGHKHDQHEVEELLEKAMMEAGVAEAVEVYEKTEAIYAKVSATMRGPSVVASNSTSVEARRG